MFHHFHGNGYLKSQGSLSTENFREILSNTLLTTKILSAHEYLDRHKSKKLRPNETCITFDDGLLCQFQIAKPILEEYGLTAFFFIHSLPFFGDIDKLELYRYFRNSAYSSIDDFYEAFFKECKQKYPLEMNKGLSNYNPSTDRQEFSFYSDSDKKFRFLRATILGAEKYESVMSSLFHAQNFDEKSVHDKLYMNESQIQALDREGHIIGLHSFSHPVSFHLLQDSEQELEYRKNFDHLFSITKNKPCTVSHPCGKYNDSTLEILGRMGIVLGFSASMSPKICTELTMPRKDSADLFRKINN
jgi:peptidoglycan/xylan/chitin deacetylase (PgdA/CDA1 family)